MKRRALAPEPVEAVALEADELASFPWPRLADDGTTPLGIDLKVKHLDVLKIVRKHCRIEGLDPDDLLQEIYAGILRKNLTASAWDGRRSSFSHYVCIVARSIAGHMLEAKRWRAESTGEETPDVADEHDPIHAFEVARELGLTAVQLEAQIERQAAREAEAAAAPQPVQLGLFGAVAFVVVAGGEVPDVADLAKPLEAFEAARLNPRPSAAS